MKFVKFNLIAAFILLNCWIGMAQQLPQFTQYMYNTISINPAYAGSRETLSIVGLHRSQWVGLEGAPSTQTLSIHSPLRNDKIGLGLSAIKDELGFQNFAYVYGDFSYTIQTGQNSELAFGMKAGFTSFALDPEFQANNSNDPVIFGYENRWKPNIGAGVYWHSERWYLGLSAPRILNTDYNGEDDFEALERVSYYFTGGLVFDMGESVKFKPAALLKATNGAPLSVDISATTIFNEKFYLGANYRIDDAIGGFVDIQLFDGFRAGYAYEYPISDIRPYTSGSHEILLIYEFRFKKTRYKSPRFF